MQMELRLCLIEGRQINVIYNYNHRAGALFLGNHTHWITKTKKKSLINAPSFVSNLLLRI